MEESWHWSLLHCEYSLPPSQEQDKGSDTQSDSFPEVVWSDYKGERRKNHSERGEGVHHVPS